MEPEAVCTARTRSCSSCKVLHLAPSCPRPQPWPRRFSLAAFRTPAPIDSPFSAQGVAKSLIAQRWRRSDLARWCLQVRLDAGRLALYPAACDRWLQDQRSSDASSGCKLLPPLAAAAAAAICILCRRSSRLHPCRRRHESPWIARASSGGGGGSGSGGSPGSGGGGGDDGGEPEPAPQTAAFGWKGWQDRVAADPQFVYKMVIEQVIGVTSMVAGDVLTRPNWGLEELDFVFATLVVSWLHGGGKGRAESGPRHGGLARSSRPAMLCVRLPWRQARLPSAASLTTPLPGLLPAQVGCIINFAAVYLLAPVPVGAGGATRVRMLQKVFGTYFLDAWGAPRE